MVFVSYDSRLAVGRRKCEFVGSVMTRRSRLDSMFTTLSLLIGPWSDPAYQLQSALARETQVRDCLLWRPSRVVFSWLGGCWVFDGAMNDAEKDPQSTGLG